MNIRRLILIVGLALLSGLPLYAAPAPTSITLNISAAMSLKQSLEAVERVYQRNHPEIQFRNNFGASTSLALEIENGAPADIFLSAALKPMDELESKRLLLAGTRRPLLRNELVLIAPANSKLKSLNDLTSSSVLFVALGEPNSVPAGEYALATLRSLNLADALKRKFVYARDVRQVLAYVETGNADAGFVYATDAVGSLRAKIIARVPEGSHPEIIYPAAVIAGSKSLAEAKAFNAFLASKVAADVFALYGFLPLARQ